MTHEVTAADLDLLTPGSVWVRPNGVASYFLFLTNDSIPEKHQERFPQMAVFADKDDNILSLPLEEFLSNRKFRHVEGDLEERLLNLLPIEDDSDDQRDLDDGDDNDGDDGDDDAADGDDDKFDIDGADDEQPGTAIVAGLTRASKQPFISFHSSVTDAVLPQLIDATVLADAVIGYVQSPMLSSQRVQHTLTIAAVDGIHAEDLYNSFSPQRVAHNQVFNFTVQSAEGPLNIEWDEFAGVYTAVSDERGPFWTVVFYTKLNAAAIESEDDDAPDFVVSKNAAGVNQVRVASTDVETFVIDNVAPERKVFQVQVDTPASPEALAALVNQFQTTALPVLQGQPVDAPAAIAHGTLADDPAPAASEVQAAPAAAVEAPAAKPGFMIG